MIIIETIIAITTIITIVVIRNKNTIGNIIIFIIIINVVIVAMVIGDVRSEGVVVEGLSETHKVESVGVPFSWNL